MIDEEWLAAQRFRTADGFDVVGLLGIGSENVTFRLRGPGGDERARQTRVQRLGYHIRELPLFWTGEPAYDLGRLARKLDALRGDPALDEMTLQYHRLHGVIVGLLRRGGVTGVLAAALPMVTLDFVILLMKAPGFQRRLREMADLDDRVEYDGRTITHITVNSPESPITAQRAELRRWATTMLDQIGELEPQEDVLAPETLTENPLYVWGAAVTDGFVTDDELPRAAACLDRPADSGTVFRYQMQALAVAHLLDHFLADSHADRFVEFCRRAGYEFPLPGQTG